MCSTVTKLPINVITLNPQCVKVETKEGVALTVTGVAQVMVSPDGAADLNKVLGDGFVEAQPQAGKHTDDMLMTAVEQFAGA